MGPMVVEMVPLSSVGSVANRPSPNWQVCHTTYIPLIVLAEPATYHLSGELFQQPLTMGVGYFFVAGFHVAGKNIDFESPNGKNQVASYQNCRFPKSAT